MLPKSNLILPHANSLNLVLPQLVYPRYLNLILYSFILMIAFATTVQASPYIANSAQLTRSYDFIEGQEVQIIHAHWQVDEAVSLRDTSPCYAHINDIYPRSYRKANWGSFDVGSQRCHVEFIMPHYSPSSVYTLDFVAMVDDSQQFNGFGFDADEAGVTIELVTNNPDIDPPQLDIENLQMTDESADGVTTLNLTYSVKDNISGLAFGSIYFISPQGTYHHFWAYNAHSHALFAPQDPSQWQIYSQTMTLPANAEPGIWKMHSFTLFDRAGNYLAYRLAEITQVEVVDVNAPVLSAPGDITLITNNLEGESAANPQINAYLTQAAAMAPLDGSLTVYDDAPATFPVGSTFVTFSASNSTGSTVTKSATVTLLYQAPEPIYDVVVLSVVNVTHQSAVIRWQTDSKTQAVISYGTTEDDLAQQHAKPGTKTSHNLALTQLLSNTVYYFRAHNVDKNGDVVAMSTIFSFTTSGKKK